MTGLLLLLVAGLWLVVVVFVSRWVGSLAKAPWRRAVVGGLAFALLLPLPLLDEIVGGYQFRSLCRANASEYRLGVPDPEGRTAKVVVDPSNRYISGKNLRIRHSRVTYLDAKTGEEILSFDRYVAEGGVLIRTLGISESNSPLTVGRPSCSPEQIKRESASRTYKLNTVN